MTDPSVTEPVPKRADQLVVGDKVLEEYLPYRFNKGPAVVVFKVDEPGNGSVLDGGAHTFFAYRYPNGVHDGTTMRSEAELLVYVAPDLTVLPYTRPDDDAETTQPINERYPSNVAELDDHPLQGPR